MFSQLVVVGLFALFGTSAGAAVALAVAAVTTAVSVINEITALITGVDGVLGLFASTDNSQQEFQDKTLNKLDQIYQMCGKIEQISAQIKDIERAMKQNTERILASVEYNRAKEIVADFKKNMDYVNTVFHNRFVAIFRNIKDYQSATVNKNLPGGVCDNSFDRSLSEMFSDITSSMRSQSNIFIAMSKYYDPKIGYQHPCDSLSPLDDLHVVLSDILTTFARGYISLIMSQHQFQMTTGDSKFYIDQQNTTLGKFKDTIERIHLNAIIAFDYLHTDYRASYVCDPSEWKEGDNFIRVKNYMTRQFMKYYPPHLEGRYWKSGSAEEIAKSKEHDCKAGYAAYLGVSGAKFDTESFVCTTPFKRGVTNLNYQELKNPLDRVWESRKCGQGSTSYFHYYCSRDISSDPFLSIRKLSKRLQECDTNKNEVATDVRFHIEGNVIHINLRCGVLKDGKVDPETLRWTTDQGSLPADEYVVLGSKLKSFNLDNVIVPKGALVTGAGFEVVDKRFISLMVKGHQVDNFHNGSTFGEGKVYHAPKSDKPRKLIDIADQERPPKHMAQTYQVSRAGEDYIDLTLSKSSNVFFNQAVVPYFDMTPFDSELSALPLSGVGLFYKAAPGFTGFLALKRLSPIYVYHVDVAATFAALQNAQRALVE